MPKEKSKRILRVLIMFIRILFIVGLPFLLTYLTISYFTPKIDSISYTYKFTCSEENNNCKNQLLKEFSGKDKVEVLNKEINEKLIDLKFIETLSKFPLSDFIFYDFKLTNNSEWKLSITEPQREIIEKLDIECNDKPSLPNLSTLKEIIPNFHIIKDFILNSCKPAPHYSDKEFIWGSGAWLTIEVNEKYDIKLIPSSKSKNILYIIWFVIVLALIPLFKQSIKFILKGKNYFAE